jgi:fumarate reductase subunit C
MKNLFYRGEPANSNVDTVEHRVVVILNLVVLKLMVFLTRTVIYINS